MPGLYVEERFNQNKVDPKIGAKLIPAATGEHSIVSQPVS
jgi:hypothetical protein